MRLQMIANRHRMNFPPWLRAFICSVTASGRCRVPCASRCSAYCDAWEHHTSEDAWATSWWNSRGASAIASHDSRRRARFRSDPAKRFDRARDRRIMFRFPERPRNKVVTTALDFPSMEYIWDAQRQIGAHVEVVPSSDGISVPLEKILDAIDNETCSRRVGPHVLSQLVSRRRARRSSSAHTQKARSCCSTFTNLPASCHCNAADWKVDFLIGGTIKWLCGGPSCGYLYVRPDLQRDLRPRLTGWVAHDAPLNSRPRRCVTRVRCDVSRKARRVFPRSTRRFPGSTSSKQSGF